MTFCETMLLLTLKRQNFVDFFYGLNPVPDLNPETEPETETNLEVDRNQNSSNVGTLNWNRNNRHGSSTLF
jgi:hypothetical protein